MLDDHDGVLRGRGSWAPDGGGTVAAAVLIGMSDGIVSVFFSPNLAKIIATLLVVLVLLIKPNGLFGISKT